LFVELTFVMKARAISGVATASLLVLGLAYAQEQPPSEAETPYDAPSPSSSAPTASPTAAPTTAPKTAPTAVSLPPYVGPGPVKPESFGPKAMPQPTTPDRPREEERDGGPDGKLIGGIIAAVVGVGAVITFGVAQGQIAYLQDDPAYEKYRRGLSPALSACDEAKAGRVVDVGGAAQPAEVVDLCKTAHTYELVSYTMLPTGIVMLGLGGYLIFTSDTARGRASLEIAPRVGWSTGGVDLVVSY